MPKLTQPQIEFLNQVKELHTTGWDALGISQYKQNEYPTKYQSGYGNCGCAEHTIDVFNSLNSNKLYRELVDNYFIYNYLFGRKFQIRHSARELGFPPPKRFERRDLVHRINRLLKEF